MKCEAPKIDTLRPEDDDDDDDELELDRGYNSHSASVPGILGPIDSEKESLATALDRGGPVLNCCLDIRLCKSKL